MTTLAAFFENVVSKLKKEQVQFAVTGGLIASVYRMEPRGTQDVDLLFFATGNTEKAAEKLIRSLGLKPQQLRKADLEGVPMFAIKRRSTPVFIVAGRGKDGETGLDLLLPALPWAQSAIERAQSNQINFGFGGVPCVTPEDLIISKLYAVANQSKRFMDLDDLKSIFIKEASGKLEIDLGYLIEQSRKLKLKCPEILTEFLSQDLRDLWTG